MSKTRIPWATHSWNPTVGCTHVSAGCAHCFAERFAKRLRAMGRPEYRDVVDEHGWTGVVNCVSERLGQRFPKGARVFVDSMSDLFHPTVPDAFIEDVFYAMQRQRETTYLVLTKRAERMCDVVHEWMAGDGLLRVPGNIWLGVTAENQAAADARVPWLLQIPTAVHFVSVEPMLGPVDLTALDYDCILAAFGWEGRVDWVICGGEAGPGFRPFDTAWAEALYHQCAQAGVAFFGKQGAGLHPGPLLIEGREIKEWPEVRA